MGKRRGTLWILSGLLLLLGAAGLTAYNLNQDMTAGAESSAVIREMTAILEKTPVKPAATKPAAEFTLPEEEPAPLELDGRSYMGLITLPTLELQLPVQEEWSYPNLRVSPCRMAGSPATEDLVILAHNYRTHFGSLNRLEEGDEVSVTLTDGTTYVYQVNAKEVVPPTAVESVTSGEWPLTLFTCTLGGKTRLVVRCDLVE